MNLRYWTALLRTYTVQECRVFIESAVLRRRTERDIPVSARDHNVSFDYGRKRRLERIFLPSGVISLSDDEANRILREAGEILLHRFDLLGSGMMDLSRETDLSTGNWRGIDWHRDAISGYCWKPGRFHSSYERFGVAPGADVKFPRELSRCHHLVTLGVAYGFTHDEEYATEFMAQVSDWIRENPFCHSINWDCAMDVAIRAANWIVALDLFADCDRITDTFRNDVEQSLFAHSVYIVAYLEYGQDVQNGKARSLGGNHYLADLCGLLFIVVRFPEWKESPRWRLFALRQLFREIELQLMPEGVHYEFSIGYHRLVLEMLLYTLVLLERNGTRVSDEIRCRVERGFEFVIDYTKPDGNAPAIGDADDGQFLRFGEPQLRSHRYLLSLAAAYFGRSEFAVAARDCDASTKIVFGPSALPPLPVVPAVSSVSQRVREYRNERLAIVRRDTGLWMFCSATGPGIYGHGGHTHNDLLAFELSYGGDDFLIDSGTYVYSRSPEERNQFRGTRAHNTVVIDGEEQQRLGKGWDLWTVANDGNPRVRFPESEGTVFCGEHSGYSRLPAPVVHKRTINLRTDTEIVVIDEFLGSGEHEFEWNWHVAPDVKIGDPDLNAVSLKGASSMLKLTCSADLSISLDQGWVSCSYGKKTPNTVLRMKTKTGCPKSFQTVFQVTPHS